MLVEKQLKRKEAGVITQVIECLPSKLEGLSSNPSTTSLKKKKERERERKEEGKKEGEI
jgi:hypothetical protein